MSETTDMAEPVDTVKTDQPRADDEPEAQPSARSPRWRRLLRRDAGFGALVLAALLVTVLVISRMPSTPTTPAPTTPPQTGGTATVAVRSAAVARSAEAQIITMPNARAGLMQPAVDAQGNIWVGEMTANKLARIDSKTGQVTEWTPPNGKYNIMATAVDGGGKVWFTEQAANYIGQFDPATETFKVYSLDSAIAPRMAPQDLAFDDSGHLWFTLLSGRIGRLDLATGAIQSWQVPVASQAYPFSLAVTGSGVWFGYLKGGTVGRLDPATGKVTLTRLAHHQAAIYSMAADSSGRIWFTEMQPAILGSIDPKSGKTTELPVPDLAGDASILYSVKTTPDGAVWFASAGANSLVRYQPTKDLFTFFQMPRSQSIPFGVALGRDSAGSVWISGDGAGDAYVARVTP